MKNLLLALSGLVLIYSQPSSALWTNSVSCENNSVRLDRDGRNFQLVIEHQAGVEKLTRSGAINQANFKDGKIIISGTKGLADWNYFATAPRDNGVLLYQIMVSDYSPHTLDLAVSWHNSPFPPFTYVPNFTGYKFYNCQYNNN